MTTNEARLAIFSALVATHIDDERIVHLPLDKQLDAIANLSLLAAERLNRAIERFEDKPSTLSINVSRDWRLDQ